MLCVLCISAAADGKLIDVFLNNIRSATPVVLAPDGAVLEGAKVEGRWSGMVWRGRLVNRTDRAIRVSDVIVADVDHGLPMTTPVYAEGFTMLSQTGGTLGDPVDEGFYTDRDHYKIPEPGGLRTAYGLMTLQLKSQHVGVAFSSTHRFAGRFGFNGKRLRVSFDIEGLELGASESWPLETLMISIDSSRTVMLDRIVNRLISSHRPIHRTPVARGWCSWYCFGPNVTASDIRGNLAWAREHAPKLRYIQIDDGYQPWMGDWLDTGPSFGGSVREVIREIGEAGFEPAIWVAPFVASPESRLFAEHQDWFVKDSHGKPLRSDRIGFGGWRLGPWYVLDGTHPQAQAYLANLFKTLREEWGCTYFKLDATYWGAMHGGVHFDPRATRVQAYRRGMEAIRRGAGNAFLLGCNHPMWPSLGMIHGSRSSMDIRRDWRHVSKTGRENLLRSWQNGKLWWNDPDCLVLKHGNADDYAQFGEQGFLFHATLIYATGGMLLVGDDMRQYEQDESARLNKLLLSDGWGMSFADSSLSIGRSSHGTREMVALFNWSDEPVTRIVKLDGRRCVQDYWSDADLGCHADTLTIADMPARSARLLKITPEPHLPHGQ
jgi:alpha-galactosidase